MKTKDQQIHDEIMTSLQNIRRNNIQRRIKEKTKHRKQFWQEITGE